MLNLTPKDIEEQKPTISDPQRGKEEEAVFIPRRLAGRLKDYIGQKGIKQDHKIFPITYSAARVMSKKAGLMVGVRLRPHDLRRHAATYASRSGIPVEIVSKVILRHSNLATTQRYLGKIQDAGAKRRIEILYG